MVLAEPHMLWLLLVLPVVLAAHARHRTGIGPGRLIVVAVLRVAAVCAVLLALARPILRVARDRDVEVAVVDVSSSVTDSDLDAVRDRLLREWVLPGSNLAMPSRQMVLFDSRARLADPGLLNRSVAQWREAGRREFGGAAGSDLAAALDLAGALIPEGATGRILLFSDGLVTGPDATPQALRLGRRGIRLNVQTIGPDRTNELVLVSARLPACAGIGSTVPLKLLIDASRQGRAVISVTGQDDTLSRSFELVLRPGRQEHVVPVPLARAGRQKFNVRCAAAWDENTDNNEQVAATYVTGAYPVRVVESDPRQRAARGLRELLGPAADVRSLAPRSSLEGMGNSGLLVVADTPASELPESFQKEVCRAVADGLGLMVTGGRQSFGPGGYQESPLAEVIPLDFGQNLERRDPSVTLVIIIDTSGSMTGPRIALAKEVARLAVRRLQPHDKVGVVEFYGTKRWAARIQSAANSIDINRALNRLSAGGGTVILPAIEEAHYALLNVQTRFKHVLILTDGGVETGPFQEILTRMAEAGITASTVMVGPGQHSSFLASLAQWGRGRFYAAPDRFHLPEVILKQPETLLASPYREQPSRMVPVLEGDPVLKNVDFRQAPPLGGYVVTQVRPEADVLVQAENGEPVLVRWRHGRGFVAALTTDLGGSWSSELARWPGMATLVSNLSRQMVRRPGSLIVEPILRQGALEVAVDWDGPPNLEDLVRPLRIVCTGPAGVELTEFVEPMVPGKWNCLRARPLAGAWEIAASADGGTARGSAVTVVCPDREISATGPNNALLQRLSDVADGAAERARSLPSATMWVELWPWLAIAGVILMLLQVAIRRLPGRIPRAGRPAALLMVSFLLATCRSAIAEPEGRPEIRIAGARRPVVSLPVTPDQAYLRAREAAWQGDLAGARRILESIPAVDSTVQVDSLMAQTLELLGEDAAAIEVLRRCIGRTADPERQTALRIRLAVLLLDTNRREEGCRILRRIAGAALSPEYRRFCAILALLFGQPEVMLEVEGDAPGDGHQLLMLGLTARRAGRADAERLFEAAASRLSSLQDRRFAIQQLVTVAREQGKLSALTDRWLADAAIAPERLATLADKLRELGRVDDLLGLLGRPAVSDSQRKVIESSEFHRQVIDAAVEGGRFDSAVAVLESLVEARPDDIHWRVALARLHILQGRPGNARELLGQAVAAASRPAELFELADSARELALDDVARSAVDRAARQGNDESFEAGLWRARLAHSRGDVGKAITELSGMSTSTQDPGELCELAEAFHHYGQPGRAVDLLRRSLRLKRDEDVELRLAWLLEQTQQLEAARDLWHEIWVSSATPALRNQAGGRLLDLAAKTGTIADLAIEMEEKLGRGEASARELDLLVDLYTRIGDDLSAREILFTFARRSGKELSALRQLARAYVRMGRLAQADAILKRLIEADPAESMEYLQERAVLAVERQRPADALEAIEGMSRLGGTNAAVEELSAGVYGLLGDYEQAARSYERILETHPEEIEVWLLWANAMRDAGQAARAVNRLQIVAEQAAQDDLFLVAVDGLLNLDAGATPLRVALRRLLERIAAGPGKIYLYDAAADVLDALGRPDRINPLMEQALVFAGEQRGSLLREMMDRAKSLDRRDRHIEYGALLVGLDYNVPPQVLIELGETLLAQHRRAEADQAFARACSLGDYAAVRQKVADAYQRALLPLPARQTIAQLLLTDPDSVPLLYRDADLLAQMGRYEQSFGEYERALRLLIGRTPQFQAATATVPSEPGGRRRRVAANIDEMTQFYQPTIDSLVICARDPMLSGRLIGLLENLAREQLAGRPAPAQPGLLTQFPRLSRLSESLRWVAISLHRPDVAERFDRDLLAAFPKDPSLPQSIARQWLDWGMGPRAESILKNRKGARLPPVMAARQMARDSARLTAADESALEPALIRQLLPALVVAGRDDDARRVIERIKQSDLHPDTIRTVLMACISLDSTEELAEWFGRYVDSCRGTPDGQGLIEQITTGIRLAFNSLDPPHRRAAMAELDRLAGAYSPRSTRIDLLRLQLDPDSPGLSGEQRRRILLAGAKLLADDPAAIVGMLGWVRPEERLVLLEQAWTACKPAGKTELLLSAAGAWAWPAAPSVLEGFRRLLESSPRLRLDKFAPYSTLVRSGWHKNRLQPSLGMLVAQHLLARPEPELPVRAAAACALAVADRRDQALAVRRQAMAALLDGRKLDSEQERMIDDLVACLPADGLSGLVGGLAATQPSEDSSLVGSFLAGRLWARLGEEDQAVRFLAAAFRRAPENQTIRRQLVEYLEFTGRRNQLPAFFEPFLADRSVMQSYEVGRLAESYRLAGRAAEALRVFSYDSGTLSAIRTLELEAMLGRYDRLELILRGFLNTNRFERRFYSPLAGRPANVGGMQHYLQRQEADFPRSYNLFELLAGIEPAAREFEALWHTASVDRRDVAGLVEAIAHAAVQTGRLDELTAQLEAWAAGGVLHARDVALLSRLILEDGVELSPEVAKLLHERLLWVEPDQMDVLEARARLCIQAGDLPAAAAGLRWALAVDLSQPRRSFLDGAAPVRRLELYLSTLPPARREAEFRRTAICWIPNPLEEPHDRLDANLLRRVADADVRDLTDSVLVSAERWLDCLPANSFLPRLHRACSRTHWMAGEDAEAMAHVRRLAGLCRRTYGELHPLDAVEFLPAADRLADAGAVILEIRQLIQDRLDHGDLSPVHATRSLALLGQWSVSQGLLPEAAEVLKHARIVAGTEPCERWLWVADLARRLNRADAIVLETGMLEARLLPVPRIPTLLDGVERTLGPETAGRLALQAAAWTDDPEVLNRARRAAEAQGDRETSAKLHQRLNSTGRP